MRCAVEVSNKLVFHRRLILISLRLHKCRPLVSEQIIIEFSVIIDGSIVIGHEGDCDIRQNISTIIERCPIALHYWFIPAHKLHEVSDDIDQKDDDK